MKKLSYCMLFLLAVFALSTSVQAALVDNLQLHSTFDSADVTGTSNGSTVNDVSGPTVYNGTVGGSGITSGTGILNQAFHYPSASDNVNYGNVLNPGTSSYTASVWFNPDIISTTQFVLAKGANVTTSAGWSLYVSGTGSVGYRVNTGTFSDKVSNSASVTAGSWYHAALVIDRSTNTAYAYLNGDDTAFSGGNSFSITAGSVTTTSPLYVGRRSDTTLSFDGLIDDFAIWDRALSASEIQEIYAKGLLGFNVQQTIPLPIPEPSALVLLTCGMLLLSKTRRKASVGCENSMH